jgi:serine/threonine protein kinase
MSTPSPPRVLAGRYELHEVLAHGGFAVTHRARDRRTGHECVVKEVLYRKIEDPKVLELLEREAKVLAHLSHPRIPRFVEFFSDRADGETRLFLVQDYVPGGSLAQLAQAGRHFTEEEVVRIGLQVARILAYLHELRPPIIHRDVKPGNVVLDTAGEAWLVDFGAVRDRILHEIRTEGEGATIVGTYGYMPYEQFQGRALPASDVYALGMTLVFLLSHKEPHEIEEASGRLDIASHVRASPRLMRVVQRMTLPQPEERYADGAELCAAFESLSAEPAAPPPPPARRPSRAAYFGLAAALAIGVAGIGVVRWAAPPAVQPAPKEVTRPSSTPPRLPGNVQVLGLSVSGRLTFDGRPLESITDRTPNFWLRREGRGEVQPGIVSYRGGRFTVSALPAGRIGAQVTVDLEDDNPTGYPGDLYRWITFDVGARPRESLEIDLWKIIRLRAPQDSGAPLPGWGLDCAQMFVADEPRFDWDPVGEGLTYEYSVMRVVCPYASQATVASGETSDTEITLDLPPSAPGEFYLFNLYARRGPQRMGLITTHGLRGGLGWDYRFRLR